MKFLFICLISTLISSIYSFKTLLKDIHTNKTEIFVQEEPQEGIDHFEPVIGIFAQPSEDYDSEYPADQGYSYIPSSYVKWIESVGGRVVPVPYNLNDTELDFILHRINGFLIPGGDASLWIDESTHTGFANQTVTGYKVLKRALEFNQEGIFPLWATCMGYEMVVMIVMDDDKCLDNFDSKNHSLDTGINLTPLKPSAIYDAIPENLHSFITSQKAFYYNHRYGLDVSHFVDEVKLTRNFQLTSWASSNGKTFVATLEGYDVFDNIFLSQYHPEKNAFEWQPKINSNHDPKAIQASFYEALMFVNRARLNTQRFDSFEQFEKYSILNFDAVNSLDWDDSSHVSIYVFRAQENGDVNRDISDW